jgi:hypothetical protein
VLDGRRIFFRLARPRQGAHERAGVGADAKPGEGRRGAGDRERGCGEAADR